MDIFKTRKTPIDFSRIEKGSCRAKKRTRHRRTVYGRFTAIP